MTTTEALLTETLRHESLSTLGSDKHTLSLASARGGSGSARALVFTASTHEALLTLASSLSIGEAALTLTTAGHTVLLWTLGSTSPTEETWLTLANSRLVARGRTASVAIAGNLSTTPVTSRAIMLAGAASKATDTSTLCLFSRRGALTVAIADITVRIGWAFGLTRLACVTLLTDALRPFGLLVHEASTITVTDSTFGAFRTLSGAFLAHEPLLTLTHSDAFAAMLLTCATVLATTDPSKSVGRTAEATVAAHESFFANALSTRGAPRHTLPLTRADAAFAVLRTGGFAFRTEVTLPAFTESDFLYLIVKAGTMPAANTLGSSTRAARVTGRALPWTHTFTFGLTQLVESTLAILAANLRAEALGARLGAVSTDGTIFALTAGLLKLGIEEAGTVARATDLAPIDETRTLHHTFRTGATSSTFAFGWIVGTLAGAKE